MTKIELFASKHCWMCSNCGAWFDALWRPSEKPFEPSSLYMWMQDPPPFNYCPICGEKIEWEKK